MELIIFYRVGEINKYVNVLLQAYVPQELVTLVLF